MGGRTNLGRVAGADGDAGRIRAEGRADFAEGHYADAEFCGGNDAVREIIVVGRRGAYCSADGREGIEPGRGGRAGDDARAGGVLQNRESRGVGAVHRAVFATSVERAAVFVVDDLDAAPVSE